MTRPSYLPVCLVSGTVILRGDATETQYPFDVLPKSVGLELNSYRQADTFDVEWDASRFPFHPDDIRSLALEIRMFDRVTMDASIADMARALPPLLVGRADEQAIGLSGDGRTFTARGKDYTEVLAVRKWDAAKTVPVGESLVKVVQRLVDEAAGVETKGRVLEVVYIGDAVPRGSRASEPTVNAGGVDLLVKTKGRAKKGTKKGPPKVKQIGTKAKGLSWPAGLNYLDVITDLCALSGKRVYVRGLEVVITSPADIIDDGLVYDDDGTVGQNLPRAYHVAWGRNVAVLDVTRKSGGERTPQQIVKCYDPTSRKTLIGKYPEVRGEDDPEAAVRLVHGVDKAAVEEMARSAWHEIALGESEIEIETRDLTDLGSKNLLEARAGDSIRIDYDPASRDELARLGKAERIAYLRAAGFGPSVAKALAENLDAMERWNRVYYVRRVAIDFDNTSGVTIKIAAVNYLGTRATTQLQDPTPEIDLLAKQNMSDASRLLASAAGVPR